MLAVVALVVGASVAGVRTAQALRKFGYQDEVILLGEENEIPYDKPPLSKGVLAGTMPADRIRLTTPEAARQLGVTLRLGERAVSVDPRAHEVSLGTGESLRYDHLVIATGCSARRPAWSDVDGVQVLRTLGDSLRLAARLHAGTRLVVVGGGFIGAEVAATACALGVSVTVVDPLPVPIGRVVGDRVGRLVCALHERHGVHTRFGVGVSGIEQGSVTLADGSVLPADSVVVGVGVTPNVSWLETSDIPVDQGIVCDSYCRLAGVPDVYAAGDVARWLHPRHEEYVRVEHWTNAAEQAERVARNIACPQDTAEYAPVEYVWSDQHDWKIQITGRPETAVEAVVIDTGRERARFAALYGEPGGGLVGAVTVNWPRATLAARKVLARGATLAEAHDDLGELV